MAQAPPVLAAGVRTLVVRNTTLAVDFRVVIMFGASRAVSQAHAISANDIGLAQSDENTDEIPQKRVTSITSPRRSRLRSNSLGLVLSSEAQSERNDKIGVLQTQRSNEARPASPPLTRSRSSSVSLPPKEDLSSPPVPSPQSSKDVLSTDPCFSPDSTTTFVELKRRLRASIIVLCPELAILEILTRSLKLSRISGRPAVEPIVPEFNMALEAIQASRPVGEPLTLLIETLQ
ncbi:hypothetical protein C8J56DRAFT_1125680 [Mycena floridula]|nr:hypothetical protein C8J56DRAFT_1125680 [Mycena floridula]